MKVFRGVLYFIILSVLGYYTFKIQIIDDRLTTIDICLVATCLGIASVVGKFKHFGKLNC